MYCRTAWKVHKISQFTIFEDPFYWTLSTFYIKHCKTDGHHYDFTLYYLSIFFSTGGRKPNRTSAQGFLFLPRPNRELITIHQPPRGVSKVHPSSWQILHYSIDISVLWRRRFPPPRFHYGTQPIGVRTCIFSEKRDGFREEQSGQLFYMNYY